MAAAMPVLTISSTNATDWLLILGEMYFRDSRGWRAYCTARSIIKTKDRFVRVELGCCSSDL